MKRVCLVIVPNLLLAVRIEWTLGLGEDRHTVVGLASRSCAESVSHSWDDSIKGIVIFGLLLLYMIVHADL